MTSKTVDIKPTIATITLKDGIALQVNTKYKQTKCSNQKAEIIRLDPTVLSRRNVLFSIKTYTGKK